MYVLQVVIILFFLPSFLFAQEKDLQEPWTRKALDQSYINAWHQQSPLGRAEILDLVQDDLGYLWMASSEGLLRFDGSETRVFDLNTSNVLDRDRIDQVAFGPDKKLWFSTNTNLFYYQNGEIHLWSDAANRLKENISRLEYDGKGNLWALAGQMLFKVDEQAALYDPLGIGEVSNISKIQDGYLAVVDTKGQVFKVNDSIKKQIPELNNRFENKISYVSQNTLGAYYVALDNGDLYKVEGNDRAKINWNAGKGKTFKIKSLMADSQGYIWIASDYALNQVKDTKVTRVDMYWGLSDPRINQIYEDKSGDIWIGTYSGVSFVYESAVGFVEYWKDDLEVAVTRAVIEDQEGNIWVGSENLGMFQLKNNQLIPAKTSSQFPVSINTLHLKNNGELLIGGKNGLYVARLRNGVLEVFDQITSGEVRAVFEREDGEIWIHKGNDQNSFFTQKLVGRTIQKVEELDGFEVNFFAETPEGQYLVGSNNGLFHLKNDHLEALGEDLGFEKEQFNDYWYEDRTLWVTSRTRGLVRIKGDSIKLYHTGNGLSIKNSSSVIFDLSGALWLGGNYGFNYIPKRQFEELITDQDTLSNVEYYPVDMSDKTFGFPKRLRTAEGRILVTTDWGLTDIQPRFTSKRQTVLDIQSFAIDQENKVLEGDTIFISATERNLRIKYTALDFVHNGSIEFETKLDGFDEDWQSVKRQRTAVYTNLSSGTYQFQLRIKNRPDVAEKSLVIVKAKRWYEFAWVKLLLFLLSIALLMLLGKWRTLRIRQKNKRLQTEVDLRTKELQDLLDKLEELVLKRTERLTQTNEQLSLAMEAGKHSSYYLEHNQDGEIIHSEYQGKLYAGLDIQQKGSKEHVNSWYELIHPEDRAVFQSAYDRVHCIEQGNDSVDDFHVEYRVRLQTGKTVWIESIGRVVERFEGGEVKKFIGMITNIDERKKLELERIRNVERLNKVLDASQDAILDWGIESGKLIISPALNRMLGYPINKHYECIEDLLKMVNTSDIQVFNERAFIDEIEAVGKKQYHREFRMRTADGKWLWVLLRGKLVIKNDGSARNFVGTISDISDEKQKVKEKLEAILFTEDNERSRISREIHDGLQQTLGISALNFERAKKEINDLSEKGQRKFLQGWEYLQKAIGESRTVAHDLMPKAIVDFGLVRACTSLINEYNDSQELTTFYFDHNLQEGPVIEENIEVTFYRIIQEAINNIIKYAEASEVNIQLRDYGDIIMLTIEDNGKGFAVEDVMSRHAGFGINSMRNRIDAIAGVFEIDSTPGEGTVIIVQVSKEIVIEDE